MLRLVRSREFREEQSRDILLEKSYSTIAALRVEAESVIVDTAQSSLDALTALCVSFDPTIQEEKVFTPVVHIDPLKHSLALLTEQCESAIPNLRDKPNDALLLLAQQAIANVNVAAPIALAEQCGQITTLTPELQASVSLGGLGWPPGQVGAVARYIYSVSPRPVKEISIAAALAFFAGIVGKTYNIENSGLNLYIILIARSAVGKEAMNSGISKLVKAVDDAQGNASHFIDFSNYVSAPALLKSLPERPCSLNINGEFGRKLAAMAEGRDGALAGLRTLMTDLYQKSGRDSIVGGSAYSKKEDGSEKVKGVAYSLLGETTPQTFFECLTPAMMEDGFLSRFTLISYKGERPMRNKVMSNPVPPALLTYISDLTTICYKNNGHGTVLEVQFGTFADAELDRFSDRCDAEINGVFDEGVRQMWNRAHLKAQRIAAVLAVADNPHNPVIQQNHCEWGIECVLRDIKQMKVEMKEGNVGNGDDSRQLKLLSELKKYIKEKPQPSYKIKDSMWEAGIIPRRYLQIKCQRMPGFNNHRMGAIHAMNSTVKELISNGYVVEAEKAKTLLDYGFGGQCLRVIDLPD
jgi:hypothetical protein